MQENNLSTAAVFGWDDQQAATINISAPAEQNFMSTGTVLSHIFHPANQNPRSLSLREAPMKKITF